MNESLSWVEVIGLVGEKVVTWKIFVEECLVCFQTLQSCGAHSSGNGEICLHQREYLQPIDDKS